MSMGINNKDFSALWPQEDDNSYEDTAEREDGSEEGRVRADVGRVSLEAAATDGHPAWFKGTQAWDNFAFFYLNQILICPS